jgi:subtilase family serine protease
LTFILALKQQNLDALEDFFWSVSDPKSELYRKFWDISEVNSLIAPKSDDVQAVKEWLSRSGVANDQIDPLGDALEVKASVGLVEKLFHTEMYQFQHTASGESIIRQFGQFSVPSHVEDKIDLVSGLSTFPIPHYGYKVPPPLVEGVTADDVDRGIVAQTIYNLYNLSSQTTGSASSTTSQGVIEFESQTFEPSDLSTYSQLVGIPVSAVPANQIIGSGVGPAQTEATLDIEFIATVNTEASNWFWLEAGENWLYSFSTHFFSTPVVPQVISISYGWWEGDQCNSGISGGECSAIGVDSDQYVARVNTEFQKIGLRGVSIIVSSGDSGAHTRTDYYCNAPTLRVEFPAGSPYVTAVGATQLVNSAPLVSPPTLCTESGLSCAASGQEQAVSYSVAGFASGGGFSEVAARPSYQTAAVTKYFSSGVALPPSSFYNPNNRGGPDVAAVGHNNLIYNGGYIEPVGGTSASSPIFAAIVALLNQANLAQTGSTLGFLNPLLYYMADQQPNTFTDVTVGDNICTEAGCSATCTGWRATTGWDPGNNQARKASKQASKRFQFNSIQFNSIQFNSIQFNSTFASVKPSRISHLMSDTAMLCAMVLCLHFNFSFSQSVTGLGTPNYGNMLAFLTALNLNQTNSTFTTSPPTTTPAPSAGWNVNHK